MKNRIKFFGLSFFSDKIASEAAKRSFATVFIGLLLSFVFFLFGYYGADVAPFATHYNNAGSYKEFIQAAFDNGVDVTVINHKCTSGKVINTYSNEEDVAYKKNGYNLIVDTRPSDTLIEFEQVAIKGESEIAYGEWIKLSDTEKQGYRLVTRYTDRELELSEEELKSYKQFLNSDETLKKELDALDGAADDYGRQVYYLYVKNYYTKATSVYSGAKAPVLRDYYYANYIASGKAYYFYVFDDMCAGSFKTDNGVPVVFGGYFVKCADGKLNDIHGFIKDTYYDTAGYTFTSYFVSAVSQLPMLVIIPILLGAVMWLAGKAVKDGWEKSFAGCYKTVCSFVWFSAFVAALVTFICGWFVAARVIHPYMIFIFAGLLLVRTAVYCVVSAVKNKSYTGQNKNNEFSEDKL